MVILLNYCVHSYFKVIHPIMKRMCNSCFLCISISRLWYTMPSSVTAVEMTIGSRYWLLVHVNLSPFWPDSLSSYHGHMNWWHNWHYIRVYNQLWFEQSYDATCHGEVGFWAICLICEFYTSHFRELQVVIDQAKLLFASCSCFSSIFLVYGKVGTRGHKVIKLEILTF